MKQARANHCGSKNEESWASRRERPLTIFMRKIFFLIEEKIFWYN